MSREPIYLGDGAYAEEGDFRGQICVYTSNGISRTNTVYLETGMLDRLHAWAHADNREESKQ